MAVAVTSHLCTLFLALVNWHTFLARQGICPLSKLSRFLPMTSLRRCAAELVSKHGFANKKKSKREGGENDEKKIFRRS